MTDSCLLGRPEADLLGGSGGAEPPQGKINFESMGEQDWVPIGDHFVSFWKDRWKCENDGFIYPKASLSGLEGVPRELLCSTFAQCFSTCFSEQLFGNILPSWTSKGSWVRTRKGRSNHFFDPASLGGP